MHVPAACSLPCECYREVLACMLGMAGCNFRGVQNDLEGFVMRSRLDRTDGVPAHD